MSSVNFANHSKRKRHVKSLQAWVDQVNAGVKLNLGCRQVEDSLGFSNAHIAYALHIAKEPGSFSSFSRWLALARLTGTTSFSHGRDGGEVCAELINIIGEVECMMTGQLFACAAVIGSAPYAMDSNLLIRGKAVLWKLPPCLHRKDALLPHGVASLSGNGSPWVANRIIGVSRLGKDHSAEVLRDAIVSPIRGCCPVSIDDVLGKVKFYASDSAADAGTTYRLLRISDMPNLNFELKGSSHSRQLVLQNAMQGDSEVSIVQGLVLTDKDPTPSLSRFLQSSERFANKFQDHERDDHVRVLKNFGFAPQRFDSKAKPLGRFCMRLRQQFGALADEAETGSAKRRLQAKRLIDGLANYKRLMLVGLLADLAQEHKKWVREGDEADLEVSAVGLSTYRFRQRLQALSEDGLIFEASMASVTFTGQVAGFLQTHKLLYYTRNVVALGMPPQRRPCQV